jgi:trk system potassium uptake protein TrkA
LKIVVCGCGQVGMKVAEALSQQKHQVTVIDRDMDTFRKLEAGTGCQFVIGDATDQDVLRKAETESADAFLALTGEDNANLFAAQVAKEILKVKKVIVRLADPVRANAFAEMGLTTICGTDLMAELIKKKIGGK